MIEYTVDVYTHGTKFWYLNDKLHREDGPAVEWANGTNEWYRNGKYHREDGPAVEYANGDKYWFLDGKLHREDGPAIEWANGHKSWYLNDEELTEELTEKQFNNRKTKELTVAEIEELLGYKVKIVKEN